MLGLEPAELLGRNMHALAHHSRADGSTYLDADCPIFHAFRAGVPCRVDSEVFWRRDRSSFPVEYSGHPITEGTRVRGAVITFVDISERRQAADTDGVREAELRRIARDLHDELGSLLQALKRDIAWLDKRLGTGPATEDEDSSLRERMLCRCQNMGRLVDSAMGNIGRIVGGLRPGVLEQQGLWAALERQAHDFAQSAELELEWDMQAPGEPQLPEPAAVAVFRVFQEMLSNVGRHAQASRISARIAADGARLRITLEDNGCGASPEAFDAPDAYGVMGMRERARQLGGHIAVSSEVGHGSAVTLVLPLEQGEPCHEPQRRDRKDRGRQGRTLQEWTTAACTAARSRS
jgi:signal transduction histidine kinase